MWGGLHSLRFGFFGNFFFNFHFAKSPGKSRQDLLFCVTEGRFLFVCLPILSQGLQPMKNLSYANVFASCTWLSSTSPHSLRLHQVPWVYYKVKQHGHKGLTVYSSMSVDYCLLATSGMCDVSVPYSPFAWLCAGMGTYLSKTTGVSNTCTTEPHQKVSEVKHGLLFGLIGASSPFDRASKVHHCPTSLSWSSTLFWTVCPN